MSMPNDPVISITVAGAEARVLADSDLLQLTCGAAGCSSTCCKATAPIVLNPYEIARICTATRMSYEDLLDVLDTDRAKGFPLVMLPRDPACHFWTATGCRIYEARPLACRLFPLGRVFEDGRSHIVLPEVNRCSGLVPAPSKTVAVYLQEQDTALFIEMADRWIEFASDIERLPLQDTPVTSVAFHMLVYSPDTPPSPGQVDESSTREERFLLRLSTAREQLPRFLKFKP
jgi:Fe-S-cluster containining protein